MIHPIKRRFYSLWIQQDLFGIWCLVKCYGGLTNKHRKEDLIAFSSKVLAYQALVEVEHGKLKRGYETVYV